MNFLAGLAISPAPAPSRERASFQHHSLLSQLFCSPTRHRRPDGFPSWTSTLAVYTAAIVSMTARVLTYTAFLSGSRCHGDETWPLHNCCAEFQETRWKLPVSTWRAAQAAEGGIVSAPLSMTKNHSTQDPEILQCSPLARASRRPKHLPFFQLRGALIWSVHRSRTSCAVSSPSRYPDTTRNWSTNSSYTTQRRH